MTRDRLLARAVAAAAVAAALPALAQQEPVVPEGSTGDPAAGLETGVTGYLDQRLTLQRVRTGGLVPADEVPRFVNLTEANVQLKLRFGDRALALGDASFFYQKAAAFPGGDKDVPAYRPLAVLSELYADYAFTEHARLTVGKKRVVWGPGLVVNPTDLLNPPKDPTDPSLQRAGAWLARLEMPFERFTVSLLGAGKALREFGGIPATLVRDRAVDDQAHYAAAARLYLLLADTDINLIYYFTHLYEDAFERKSRLGLTFSRLLGKALEVHAEALGQLGSARAFVDPACVVDAPTALDCVGQGRLATRSKLDSRRPNLRGLFGGRYTFGDDSMLGADYLLNTEGLSDDEWRALLALLALGRQSGFPVRLPSGAAPAGSPQRFAFEPLRRHYLFLFFSKPRIRDDFTLTVTAIGSLHDLSGRLAPQLAWSVRAWLSLTLHAFAPLPALRPTTVDGTEAGELELAPADWRAVLSGRVFY